MKVSELIEMLQEEVEANPDTANWTVFHSQHIMNEEAFFIVCDPVTKRVYV